MESEEILGPQFSVHWSTCSSIPGKRFPITSYHLPNLWKAISYHLNIIEMMGMISFFGGFSAEFTSKGAEIWRYDSDGNWTQQVSEGLNSYLNLGMRKMAVFNDCLYGVTANHDEGMELWRTCDGDNWEVVIAGGFGSLDNTSGRGMGIFKG